MIVSETNRLITSDLPRRAVANETFKEQSERNNLSFTTKYGQYYISFYDTSIFTYFLWLQTYNGVENKCLSKYFSQNFRPNLALCNDVLIQAKLSALMEH